MQMVPRKKHKKGETSILTDTSEMESLEAEAQAKLDKKTEKWIPKREPDESLKSESLKNSKLLPIDEEAQDSSSDKDMQLIDDSDDESLHIGNVSELQTDQEFSPRNLCLWGLWRKKNSDKHQIFEHQNIKNIKHQISNIKDCNTILVRLKKWVAD